MNGHWLIFSLAACTSPQGQAPSADGPNSDSTSDVDATLSLVVIRGHVMALQAGPAQPVDSAKVSAYPDEQESAAVATATSDATGAFEVQVPEPFVGHLRVAAEGIKNGRFYFSSPPSSDLDGIVVAMISESNWDALLSYAHIPQRISDGVLRVTILQSRPPASPPVKDATIVTNPASELYRYSDGFGIPTSMSATANDGAAYAFNVPVGEITATATRTGVTFLPTTLFVHPDSVTSTLITP